MEGKTKIAKIEDPKNIIFKWIIKVFYGEPVSSYYWKNFKKQAFTNDKGVDITDRFVQMNLYNLSSVDAEVTDTLLQSQPEILDMKMPSNQKENLRNLFQVAVKVRETWVATEKIRDIEKQQKDARAEVDDYNAKIQMYDGKIKSLEHQKLMLGKFHSYVRDVHQTVFWKK